MSGYLPNADNSDQILLTAVQTGTAGDRKVGALAVSVSHGTLTGALPAGDNNIGNVDLASALPAGTNSIGKVAADPSNLGTPLVVAPPMTFAGKTAGQTFDVPHVARSRWSVETQAPTNLTDTSETNATGYSQISVQDGTPLSYSHTLSGKYAQYIFSFDLLNDLKNSGRIPKSWDATTLKAALESLTITWVGYGVGSNGGVSTNGATLKYRNIGSDIWGTLGTNTASSPASMSSTNPTTFANMVDANGVLHVLAHSTYPSDGTIASTIYTDFVKVDVQFTAEYLLTPDVETMGRPGQVAPSKAVAIGGTDGTNLQALKVDAQKNLLVGLRSSSGQEPYMLSPGDGDSNGRIGVVAVTRGQKYNGSTWDSERNNTEGTLLASAARTTGTVSANQTNHNARGVMVTLNVTAVGGAGGLQVQIQHIDPASGSSVNLNASPTVITAVGRYGYVLCPGANASPTAANAFVQQFTACPLPRTWRVSVLHSDGSSYTYSVGYALIV